MTDPMQQARELLPCPFCGGDAERIDFGPGDAENDGGSCIACKRCHASGPVEFGFKENFIANWNRRAALRAAPEGLIEQHARDSLELRRLCQSRDFYKRRCEELQKVQSSMRDPERKAVCDILANGETAVFAAARPQGVSE